MREESLLAPQRPGHPHGNKAHEGTIIPDRPDVLWGTDATGTLTGEGMASIFLVIDHYTAECLGIHAARRGTRWEALEPLWQAVNGVFREVNPDVAKGLALRHDHGSQFISHVYQSTLRTLGIQSSPAYVKEPEGNGCAERFVRTLKEQLLWLKRFDTVEDLRAALQDFKDLYNSSWLIQRHGHISPKEARNRAVTCEVEAA
jgi:transposase InsO family protein